jgi:hypothetical protein
MGLNFKLTSLTFACDKCSKRYRIPIEAGSFGHNASAILCIYCYPKYPLNSNYQHMIDILRILKNDSGLSVTEISGRLPNWEYHIIQQSIEWLLENIMIDEYQGRYFYRQLYRPL